MVLGVEGLPLDQVELLEGFVVGMVEGLGG